MVSQKTIFALGILCVLTFGMPENCLADAQADLTAGRTALDAGDLDQALKLLTASSAALPQSVEAQLALAECHLKLGQIDKALVQYRAVLKLSPNHPAAKKIVEGLQGSGQTFSQRVESAELLLKLGAFAEAEAVARQAVALPVEPAQRSEARVLLARILLLVNSPAALDEAVRALQDGQHGEARAFAALALLAQPEPNVARIEALLKDLQEVPASIKPLRDLALLLIQLEDESQAAAVSSKLASALQALPPSPHRPQNRQRAVQIAAIDFLLRGRGHFGHGSVHDQRPYL